VHRGLLCRALTVWRQRAGRLFDRADLDAGELGVDEELERVGLLVLLHEAVQRSPARVVLAGWRSRPGWMICSARA
jgi:hypothetical protein